MADGGVVNADHTPNTRSRAALNHTAASQNSSTNLSIEESMNSSHYTSTTDNEISFITVDRAPSTAASHRSRSVHSGRSSRASVSRHSSTPRSLHSTIRSNHSASMVSLSDTTMFRLDTMESDVGVMKSDVAVMKTDIDGVKDSMLAVNTQLAFLVRAAQDKDSNNKTSQEASSHGRTPNSTSNDGTGMKVLAQPTNATNGGPVPGAVIPPPKELRAQANADGFVDRHIKMEEMGHQRADGKNPFISDIFTEKLIGKPYMFMEREGVRTLKEKLDARGTMSSKEYINALIALTKYKPAYDQECAQHIITHLHEVSTDDLTRDWKRVMAWSQHVFDQVEKKQLFWHEYQEIQNLRFRLCYSDRAAGADLGKSNYTSTAQSLTMTCPEFNQVKGCGHRGDHSVGSVKLLHACAFCFGKGKQLPHNIIACNNKMFMSTHSHQPTGSQGNRGEVSSSGVYTSGGQQRPKN